MVNEVEAKTGGEKSYLGRPESHLVTKPKAKPAWAPCSWKTLHCLVEEQEGKAVNGCVLF